jgi:hypothetical protein
MKYEFYVHVTVVLELEYFVNRVLEHGPSASK